MITHHSAQQTTDMYLLEGRRGAMWPQIGPICRDTQTIGKPLTSYTEISHEA